MNHQFISFFFLKCCGISFFVLYGNVAKLFNRYNVTSVFMRRNLQLLESADSMRLY